jgi:hypothetical protein
VLFNGSFQPRGPVRPVAGGGGTVAELNEIIGMKGIE